MEAILEVNNKVMVDVIRARVDLQDKVTKLQQEAKNITQPLDDAEHKASVAIKGASNLDSQLTESQQLLEEETRQKLILSSKLCQIESEKQTLIEQLDVNEKARKSYEKLTEPNVTIQDMRKRFEEESKLTKGLEELKRKIQSELEDENSVDLDGVGRGLETEQQARLVAQGSTFEQIGRALSEDGARRGREQLQCAQEILARLAE
ncbi:myosin heavy chain, non-muscle-like [Anopheles cruzii]|uniref:myosin heavy chain, non-muscle-like n=1 Tax=Anopheles cruzii TaxID=68878 RepID=UPI0022EC3548|nr:myosin heavy chain, non-muscle-like [Anopheles cruzii]XP_052871667.1 myosin heavy chain, non-muscle-like [Anopheles cruzii]XP_052871668.1 myosin heavy chain, non-muscle-like [Anopheles cruzii]